MGMAGFLLIFFLCFLMVFFYNVHYFIIFLFLEFSLLIIFLSLSLSWYGYGPLWSLIFFLLVVVCMGGYGISLLVHSTRFVGRDFWVLKLIF